MNMFNESDEEDNNPFSGTNHLYASGIASMAEGEDDFIPKGTIVEEQEENASNKSALAEEGSSNDDEYENGHLETIGGTTTGVAGYFEPYVSLSMSMANTSALESDGTTIQIPEAGHYKDPWGKHAIGYVIKYQGKEIIRRYSEFDTLRQALVRLLPTIVIPPIPSKHPLIKYFLRPLSAETDSRIIEKRKRMLASFLNNCYAVQEIKSHVVFNKFLDPEYSWKDVLNSPPIVILPINNLLAPPLNPTKPSPLHSILPAQTSLTRLDPMAHNGSSTELESKFAHIEGRLRKYKHSLQPLQKILRQHRLHFHSLSSLYAELGAYYNAFSLQDNVLASESYAAQIKSLSDGIEKVGHGFDVNYVSSEILVDKLLTVLEEPSGEMLQFLEEAKRVLHFRKLKQLQFQIIETTIAKREARIKSLKETQHQMKRLEEALQQNALESPTIAEAVKRLETTKSAEEGSEIPSKEPDQQFSTLTQSSQSTFLRQAKKSRNRRRGRNGDLEPHLLTEEERRAEVQRLYTEVEKLTDCFKLIKKDMEEVNQSSLHSLSALIDYIDQKWMVILKAFTKSVVSWLTECLKAWKNAKKVVSSIETERSQ